VSALLLPNSELVAAGWLAAIPGWSSAMVGTTLPRIGSQGPLPAWAATGFATVAVVGGTPGALMPVAEPVVSINCWAVNASVAGAPTGPINVSNKPPWGHASQLCEQIRQAAYTLDKGAGRSVAMPAPGYAHAAVTGAQLLTEPRRLPADLAGYARFQMEIQLRWVAGSQ
jgi:hypothetical protein